MLSTTGCESIKGVFGKNSKAETKQATKIEDVSNAIVKNDKDKMDNVSVLASGTDYALNKVTNKEPPVYVAKDINQRIMSLSGKPNLQAEKEIWEMVDNLISQNAQLRLKGQKELQQKDLEIAKLQEITKVLDEKKDVEIAKYMKIASDTAMLADTRKAELDEYQGWFGIKAVVKGLSQFVKTSMWILIGIAIVFIILRFAASANPVAAAIFGLFEQVVAGVVKTIQVLFPKAISFAGHISKESYNQVSSLLKKLVDNIQNIKQIEKKTGKDITLKEVLVELDKSMDQSEKELVSKIKKELGY